MLKIKFIKIDFACITKEAFMIVKSVVISNINTSIINLDLVNTKAKTIIVLIFNLKTFFIYNFVKILKLTTR